MYLELIGPFYLDYAEANILLAFRYIELQKHLQILNFNILSGSYHQSIRELRFILETFIQTYYIDKNHPNSSINCKLEILKEIDLLIGSRLIDKTDLGKYKNDIKKLYSDLSKHVHSSFEKLNPVFEYNRV